MPMDYHTLKLACGAIATIGLYSVLFKENKFYRFFEHMFLGLAAGWALVAVWTDTLHDSWWVKMVGDAAKDGDPGQRGYWMYAALIPVGLMGYFVFSKKYNWMVRIPVGMILGLYSGNQIYVWWTRYGPQLNGSLKPIFPNTFSSFFVPAKMEPGMVYPSQAISNAIFVFTVISVSAYFLFSLKMDGNKTLQRLGVAGRWLLMIGFGAIFGSTVTMRFTLFIDRMNFILVEFIQNTLLPHAAK